jgi:hypothetical protein
VISARLQEAAQNAAEYDGTSMSALVSSALTLWLGLPAAARRTSRHVLTAGTPEAREVLLEGCALAIARAGDQVLRARLAARGQAMDLWDTETSDAEIAQAAVDAVRDASRVVPGEPVPARRRSAR